MDFSDLKKKGVFYVRQEYQRVTEMASERLQPNIKYRTYSGVSIAEVQYPFHTVGLRHVIPTSLRPGYANFSERMAYQAQQDGSSQMEGIESNRDWQDLSANFHPDDPDNPHEHPDPRRHGYGGHWRWEPDSQGEDAREDGHIHPRGDGLSDRLNQDRSEDISHASNGSDVADYEKPRINEHYTSHSATVGNPVDFEQIDSQYLNPLNLSKKEPEGHRDPSERGPSSSSVQFNEMQTEMNALREALQVLENTLEHRKKEAEGEKRDLEREKNELKGKLGQYIRKTQQLNQIIIKSANKTNEPSDTDIERATLEIYSDIVALVRTHYQGNRLSVNMGKARQYKQEPFYRNFKELSPETKRRLLNEMIFSQLNADIFSVRMYGLTEEADYHMAMFEGAILASPKINRQDAEEWRVRTVTCALQLNVSVEEKVTATTNSLRLQLCPVELSGPNKDTAAGLADLKVALRDLCEKSIKLSLKFRSTATRYAFQVPSKDSYIGTYPSDTYQIMGSEGILTQEAEENPRKQLVFCVLFGNLTKTRPATATDEEKSVVLFPAHVITYELERDREKERRDREREQKRRP